MKLSSNFTALASSCNYDPSNALVYNTDTWFQTSQQAKPQWWAVIFNTDVKIKSYQIKAIQSTQLSSWTLSVSNDFFLIGLKLMNKINVLVTLNIKYQIQYQEDTEVYQLDRKDFCE